MLGRCSEEGVYRAFPYLDNAVGYEAMGLSVDGLHGFTVGSLGKTERGSFIVIKPIRYVADSVILLNRKIEFVGFSQLGRCHTRHVVTIQK